MLTLVGVILALVILAAPLVGKGQQKVRVYRLASSGRESPTR
jgi:hypothetical protein